MGAAVTVSTRTRAELPDFVLAASGTRAETLPPAPSACHHLGQRLHWLARSQFRKCEMIGGSLSGWHSVIHSAIQTSKGTCLLDNDIPTFSCSLATRGLICQIFILDTIPASGGLTDITTFIISDFFT